MTAPLPLALLPGLLCDEALWRHQAEGLSDVADCRVADLTRQDSMADMARAVLEGCGACLEGPVGRDELPLARAGVETRR